MGISASSTSCASQHHLVHSIICISASTTSSSSQDRVHLRIMSISASSASQRHQHLSIICILTSSTSQCHLHLSVICTICISASSASSEMQFGKIGVLYRFIGKKVEFELLIRIFEIHWKTKVFHFIEQILRRDETKKDLTSVNNKDQRPTVRPSARISIDEWRTLSTFYESDTDVRARRTDERTKGRTLS